MLGSHLSSNKAMKSQNTINTIPSIVMAAAEKYGAASALEEDGKILTFRELLAQMERAAAAFIRAGLKAGDQVAIWAPNSGDWVIAALGVMAAGGAIVPLNTRMKGAEAAYILNKSKASILLTVSGFLETDYPALLLDSGLPYLKSTISLSGRSGVEDVLLWEDFLASGVDVAPEKVREVWEGVTEGSVSDIIFTSGTTGNPKGVPMTHGQTVATFEIWCDQVGLRQGDRYLIVNPFFHTFGYKAGWLACLLRGATILPHAIFDVPAILDRIAREKVSVLPGPPTLYQSLLADPALAAADISSLRLAVTGAAVIPEQLIREMFDLLGCETVVTAYGLTESCGIVTMCSPSDPIEKIAGTSGKPIEGIELRITDDNLTDMPAGTPGEILVRGHSILNEYFEDNSATAEALTEEGWLKTGDIGVLDEEGYLRITDRKKDMLIVGGFNCYPAEVENIMLSHPGLVQVAVVGRPDERMGEVPVAYAVAAERALTQEAVIKWCRERMANYKVPRAICFEHALPLNASGKVQKFLLKEKLSP